MLKRRFFTRKKICLYGLITLLFYAGKKSLQLNSPTRHNIHVQEIQQAAISGIQEIQKRIIEPASAHDHTDMHVNDPVQKSDLPAISDIQDIRRARAPAHTLTDMHVNDPVQKANLPSISDILDIQRVRAPASAHNLTDMRVTETNSVRSSRSKEILIFGDVWNMKKWVLFSPLTACFTYPNKKKGSRACPVFCPRYDTWINLTIGSSPSRFDGKDAIVFGVSMGKPRPGIRNVFVKQPLPPNVITVFQSMEPPSIADEWLFPRGKYHLTMTYHTGSGITLPYAYYKPFPEEKVLKQRNFATGKTKLLAWMGSNCDNLYWPRMEFVNRLQAHIPIDTYGKCGNLTCLPRLSEKCVHMLKQYKFYLSLENSECHEYITEKFWVSALYNDVVPIVYGASRSDYERLAPPNSFIHVSDFKNMEELARYIKLLDDDDHLYNKYFEWKTKGSVVIRYPEMKPDYFCEIIPFLDQKLERKPLSTSVWLNSCRNQTDVLLSSKKTATNTFDNWSHW